MEVVNVFPNSSVITPIIPIVTLKFLSCMLSEDPLKYFTYLSREAKIRSSESNRIDPKITGKSRRQQVRLWLRLSCSRCYSGEGDSQRMKKKVRSVESAGKIWIRSGRNVCVECERYEVVELGR